LYDSVAAGTESQRSIDSNSKADYREKLEVELKELRESELWQAGKTVRSLRPENQPAPDQKPGLKVSGLEKPTHNRRKKMESIHTATQLATGMGFDFNGALERVSKVAHKTPLALNLNLSRKYQCSVFLKREDLQVVRSYKLRGAYNMMSNLPKEKLERGLVCASAGNHAQGFAYSCKKLHAKGVIFMPVITPKHKNKTDRMFGDDAVEIRLVGDNFDECQVAAKEFTETNNFTFIPPFEDIKIIEGQSTVALEILQDIEQVDYCFCPWVEADWQQVPALHSKPSPFHKIL
jgi:hypothetical protein